METKVDLGKPIKGKVSRSVMSSVDSSVWGSVYESINIRI